jgi:hypothetical protein
LLRPSNLGECVFESPNEVLSLDGLLLERHGDLRPFKRIAFGATPHRLKRVEPADHQSLADILKKYGSPQ